MEIKSISDLVEAANKSIDKFRSIPWWRGHSDGTWKLVPGIFRDQKRADDEQLLTAEFTRQAPVIYANCPPGGDLADWLFLMQHYRLYTRLLDWTESLLIATYFAVTEYPDKAGSIWALDPGKLNKSQGMDEIVPHYIGGDVHELFKEAFYGPNQNSNNTKRILGVGPTLVDFRMQAQSAAFTIHGGNHPLENMTNNENFLMNFEIPSDAKADLKEELFLLGIKRSYLFPDLENLASFLNERGTTFKRQGKKE